LEAGNYRQVLAHEVSAALGRAFGAEADGADPMVTPATRPDFGDYQCNAALALAKRLKAKPRDVAVSCGCRSRGGLILVMGGWT
jgi:arginyl-tRNA synthetase